VICHNERLGVSGSWEESFLQFLAGRLTAVDEEKTEAMHEKVHNHK